VNDEPVVRLGWSGFGRLEALQLAALDMYDVGYIQHNYDLVLGAAAGKPIAIGEGCGSSATGRTP
jgi:hypothetical protein